MGNLIYRTSLLIGLVCLLTPRVLAESYEPAPKKLQAAILVKILAMSKEIDSGKDIRIHVVNAPATAAELRKAVGRRIGKSILTAVNESAQMPSVAPSALYIGDSADIEPLIRYCRQNQVLSISANPAWVRRGVTIGIAMSDRKPCILLNVAASKAEKITWHPNLLKLSRIYH